MHTETTIDIRAPADVIFRLAAAVERWPEILPHYRAVREIERRDGGRIVAMAAWRDWVPVSWWAEQRCDSEVPRITFRHVRGATRGMDVEWRFAPIDIGTRVSIRHDLELAWPLIAPLGEWVIGEFFVANIAGKTLRRIKMLAEGAP